MFGFKAFYFLYLLAISKALDPPYGQLKIQGRFLTDSQGKTVQLRGMALWSDIFNPTYWNPTSIQQLKCAWNSNVIRAPVGPNSTCCGGWAVNPSRSFQHISTVVEAAIDLGIYVIIDWHSFGELLEPAIDFFANMSKTYGSYPNVIYEIWNEPNGVDWPTIKAYAEQVIAVIRQNDPNNIIIVGTPTYSQRVDLAAQDPINETNIAYTLHYYAGTHKEYNRNLALTAINLGLPIFITEYGTVTASGAGPLNVTESNLWWQFNDQYQLSYVNWAAYTDYSANANAFWNGTQYDQLNNASLWAPSGILVNNKYQSTNQGVTC